MKKICPICFKEFKTSHVRVRYCSIKCAAVWRKEWYKGKNNPRWRGGFKTRKCIICGVVFESSDGRARYCPEHRWPKGERNKNWNGGRLVVKANCECCGREIFTTVTIRRRGKGKFCSQSCSNIIKNKKNKKSCTEIEKTVEKYLIGKKIRYEKQVPIGGITLADFLVGDTIIQCDGVYWHTLPGRAEKDAEQNEKLKNLGYRVLRVSDKELNVNGVEQVLMNKFMITETHNQRVVSWQ
jgi:very-short-patch-repair endonuclease